VDYGVHTMKLKRINLTDLFVSPICMGTALIGSEIGESESFERLDRFFELGGNFFDTANIYADWLPDAPESASEKTIGRWAEARGLTADIVVATKGGHWALRGETTGKPRLERSALGDQIKRSCENLRVSSIDLYYLHRDDLSLSVESIMDTLFENIDAGYLRYIGCSNWSLERMKLANEYAARCGRSGFVVSSDRWSLARFKPDRDPTIVAFDSARYEYMLASGLTEAPFQAIGKGALSHIAAGRVPSADYDLDENYILSKRAAELAAAHGVSVAAISIAYLTNQELCVIPTVFFSREEQIRDAFIGAKVELSAEEIAHLSL
ncbi:MAG: aldo/keto reductase, partial [Clostridia bacterium]|nr:aldo/keto reductase [Clostridia bacterium]